MSDCLPDAVAAYTGRELNQERLAWLREHAGASLLDVGCGNGGYVRCDELKGRLRCGVDLSADGHWTGSMACASALRLPFADGSFETVAAFEVLEHLADPLAGLRECVRVARNRVVISVPNCEVPEEVWQSSFIYKHWSDPTHVQFFKADALVRLLTEAGLHHVGVRLINQIDLAPLVRTAFDLSNGLAGRLLWKLLRRRQRQRYAITLLAWGTCPSCGR